MTMPVLVPPPHAELAVPYVTPAQFNAFPTWLDLDNLVPGGAAGLQQNALADALLAASEWAVGYCENMVLHAHWVQGEQVTVRAASSGRITLKPRDIPVRGITALNWGFDPSQMNADPLPDPTMQIPDGRLVSFIPGGSLAFTGTVLLFGPSAPPVWPIFVSWSYVAGFPNTVLSSSCLVNATSVSVADPAGILPGDVLRIYDPGGIPPTTPANEAITVAASYVPALPTIPPTATVIPLATGTTTAFAHAAQTGITGFPRKIIQAVYAYAVALLMREDVAEEVPQSRFGGAARSTAGGRGGAAAGLINDAMGWLASYRPVWPS